MNPTQPPRLHQNPAPVALVLPAAPDRFTRTQGNNLLACGLLLALGLLGHSFPALLGSVGFAGVWVFGIYTPDEHQHRFYLATFLLMAATICLLGFHAVA